MLELPVMHVELGCLLYRYQSSKNDGWQKALRGRKVTQSTVGGREGTLICVCVCVS